MIIKLSLNQMTLKKEIIKNFNEIKYNGALDIIKASIASKTDFDLRFILKQIIGLVLV